MSTQYLQNMGIQTWQECYRLPGVPDTLKFESYSLVNTKDEIVGQLYVETFQLQASQCQKVDDLLDAMLTAIQLKRRPYALKVEGLVVLMGASLIQQTLKLSEPLDALRANNIYCLNNYKVLVTYHPRDLLEHPKDKIKAWQDLKKAAYIEIK